MSSTCKGTKNHMKELGVYPKTGCRVCGSLLWLRVFARLLRFVGQDINSFLKFRNYFY